MTHQTYILVASGTPSTPVLNMHFEEVTTEQAELWAKRIIQQIAGAGYYTFSLFTKDGGDRVASYRAELALPYVTTHH